MRRFDQHCLGTDGARSLWIRLNSPTESLAWTEPPASVPQGNDAADETLAGWESAWIDLGGEG
jgi:hypothetical protein